MHDLRPLAGSLLILAGLAALPALAAARPSPTPGVEAMRGQKLFARYCTGCHGPNGRGDGPVAALLTPTPSDLTQPEYPHGIEDHDVYTVIEKGIPKTSMSGWSSALPVEQIQDLVFYLQWLRRSSVERAK